MPAARPRRAGRPALALAALLLLAGCSRQPARGASGPVGSARPGSPGASSGAASPVPSAAASAPRPAATVQPLVARLRADVMVTSPRPLAPAAVRALTALAPPRGATVFRAGALRVGGTPVHAVGVDPSGFRAFTAAGTAESDPVWASVARGEAVASHSAATTLRIPLGAPLALTRVPPAGPAPTAVRVGAFATTGLPGADVVVDDATAQVLGLAPATGVLLSAAPGTDPVDLAHRVQAVAGAGARVDLLSQPRREEVSFLTGGDAAKAFGAFSYRYFPDGTIEPDEAWVKANLRTESVPILGTVTCHRLMLPQLRGALAEIERVGKASAIHTYDGCYNPRFIPDIPQQHAVSLHTWAIAIDINAATNYRGIAGDMDPEVVAIFKRWGFRWGGDWHYTDPMHFELGALISSPAG